MEGKTFVREATGLVRGLSTFDAFAINTGILNVLVGTPFAFTTILFLFPGINVTTAFFVGFFASIPFALVYIQMGAAMPRSGGDYTWVSRTFHPALGFMTSFALYFISFYCCMSAIAYTFSSFFLSTSFSILGILTGNPNLTSLSATLAQPTVSFEIATVILAVTAIIAAAGVRILRYSFYVLIALMLIGIFAIMGTFAFTSHATFVSEFNSYSSGLGTTYQGIIDSAKNAGWSPNTNFLAAIQALPVTLIAYGGFTYAAYTAGEIKRADRALNRSIFIALILGLVMWAGSAYLFFNTVGADFLNAAAYLTYNAPSSNHLAVAPVYNLFTAIISATNPALFWVIFLGFLAAYLVFMPSYFQVLTRAIFAWSFDRMAPTFLADVSDRFHTPVKAIVVTFVFAEIFAAVWAFGSSVSTTFINSTIAWTAIFLIPALAAMIFPFRRKDLFEAAPWITKIKIGGVPLISVSGAALFILLLTAIIYGYLTPAFSGPTTPSAILTSAIFFITGLLFFYVVRAYRKSKGIDITRIYSEIPPE